MALRPDLVLVAGAKPCPHPRALRRRQIVVSDGGESQALCPRCFKSLSRIAQLAQEGRLLPEQKVTSIVLRLGYTQADADQFWRSLAP